MLHTGALQVAVSAVLKRWQAAVWPRLREHLPYSALISGIFMGALVIPNPTLSNMATPEIANVLHPFVQAEKEQRQYGFPEIEDVHIPVVRRYLSQVTAYNSVPWQTDGDPFTTAAGTHVRDGVVAANCLPFGTKLRMPDLFGDQIFVVEDRLAPRKSCFIIDVWQEYSPHSKSFGAPLSHIEILGI